MSELFGDYQLRFNFHSQSMTTFYQTISIYCLQVQQFAIRQFLTLDPEVSQACFCSSNFFCESNFFFVRQTFFFGELNFFWSESNFFGGCLILIIRDNFEL